MSCTLVNKVASDKYKQVNIHDSLSEIMLVLSVPDVEATCELCCRSALKSGNVSLFILHFAVSLAVRFILPSHQLEVLTAYSPSNGYCIFAADKLSLASAAGV